MKFHKQSVTALTVAAAVFTLSACKKEATAAEEQKVDLSKATDIYESPVPAPKMKLDPNKLFATVGDVKITYGQIQEELDKVMERISAQIPAEMIPQAMPRIMAQIKEQLVMTEVMKAAIAKAGIKIEPSEIDAAMEKIKENIPEDTTLEKALEESGMTVEDLKTEMKQNLAFEKLMDAELATVAEATDEEVKQYYMDNPDRFKKPEMVSASHILIAFGEDDTDETKAEKKAEIEALKKQIDEGADFAELAKANSDCPSKERGGELGTFPRGRMVPEFEETAFSMEVGDISDIVETQFGYHLIKLNDHQAESDIPLEEVKDRVKQMLTSQKKQEAAQAYMEKLKTEAGVVYAEEKEAPADEPAAEAAE